MTTDLVQGSLAEAKNAFGRKFIRKGYGLTEEDDVLYALGWPRLSWLEPGDASAKELADAALFSKTYLMESGPIPAGVVPRRLRDLFAYRQTGQLSIEPMNKTSPISAKECEKLFDFVLQEQFGFVCTFLLESLFTTPVVLDALVARIRKKVRPKDWNAGSFGTFGNGAMRALHFLLLRTEATKAKAIREELSALYTDVTKTGEISERAIKSLDVAVNGREGVERSGGRMNGTGIMLSDAEYAIDDLDYVKSAALAFIPKMKSADRSWVSGRLAFLAGADDDVMKAIAANVKGIHSSHRDALATDLSRCAHPLVPEIMTVLGTTRAKRWLKSHSAAAGSSSSPSPKKKTKPKSLR